MKNLRAVPVPAEGLTIRQIGNETIILAEAGEELHTLDETGTFVWSAIDGKKSLSQILDLICVEYEVTHDRAGDDLFVFVEALKGKGIISFL